MLWPPLAHAYHFERKKGRAGNSSPPNASHLDGIPLPIFSPKDYTRGLDYVRHGRVQDMRCSNVEGNTLVTCTVEGNDDDYQVHFQDYDNNYYRISCTCPRFDDMGKCKHIAAAMIAYVQDSHKEVSSQSDYYAQALLKRYLELAPRGDFRDILDAIDAFAYFDSRKM